MREGKVADIWIQILMGNVIMSLWCVSGSFRRVILATLEAILAGDRGNSASSVIQHGGRDCLTVRRARAPSLDVIDTSQLFRRHLQRAHVDVIED